MDQLLADFEKNVKTEPNQLDETVRSCVESALLRMTEKKMLADEKIGQLQRELETKDKRIQELEGLVANLQANLNRTSVMRSSQIDPDLNERVSTHEKSGYVGQTFAGVFKTESQQSGLIKSDLKEIDEDDDFWYQSK